MQAAPSGRQAARSKRLSAQSRGAAARLRARSSPTGPTPARAGAGSDLVRDPLTGPSDRGASQLADLVRYCDLDEVKLGSIIDHCKCHPSPAVEDLDGHERIGPGKGHGRRNGAFRWLLFFQLANAPTFCQIESELARSSSNICFIRPACLRLGE